MKLVIAFMHLSKHTNWGRCQTYLRDLLHLMGSSQTTWEGLWCPAENVLWLFAQGVWTLAGRSPEI